MHYAIKLPFPVTGLFGFCKFYNGIKVETSLFKLSLKSKSTVALISFLLFGLWALLAILAVLKLDFVLESLAETGID